MSGEVSVVAEAHLRLICQQRRVVNHANRLRMVIAAFDDILRPAQVDLPDGLFILRGQCRVDPVDGQSEGFAMVARAVAVGGEPVRIAERRVLRVAVTGVVHRRRRAFGGIIDHVHEQCVRAQRHRRERRRCSRSTT